MKDFIVQKALELAMPLVLGLVTPRILDLIKRGNSWVDGASPSVKQVLVFVITGLATSLAFALGVPVPTDLSAWDAQVVSTVTGGLLAIALKQKQQMAKLKVNLSAVQGAVAVPYKPPAEDSPFEIPPDGL